MLWKLLGLQKLLDSLFDDGWCTFWLPAGPGFSHDESLAPSQE
jgi:hypothetical protein